MADKDLGERVHGVNFIPKEIFEMLINIKKHHPGRGVLEMRNILGKNVLYPGCDCCKKHNTKRKQHGYTKIADIALHAERTGCTQVWKSRSSARLVGRVGLAERRVWEEERVEVAAAGGQAQGIAVSPPAPPQPGPAAEPRCRPPRTRCRPADPALEGTDTALIHRGDLSVRDESSSVPQTGVLGTSEI